MIELINLTKRYGSFTAVNDVTLSIPKGTIFAFLGTNGAGKTTTIRMMSGVLRPTSGTVTICGYDIQRQPIEAKSRIGVIPDHPYVYGKLTGREFLSFMADLYCVQPKVAAPRIEELLGIYGLLGRENDLIDSYSHGMKQRLLMCSSLVHDPEVLIVDEPMVGLDPRGAKLLKDTFRARADAGLTIFMSTHSLSVAEEVADQLAIIQHGRILAMGTLDDLYAQARNDSPDLEDVFLQIIHAADEDKGAQLESV